MSNEPGHEVTKGPAQSGQPPDPEQTQTNGLTANSTPPNSNLSGSWTSPNGILVLFTAALVLVGFFQWDSLKTQHSTSERAWVTASSPELALISHEYAIVTTLKNSGNTPALNARVFGGPFLIAKEDTDVPLGIGDKENKFIYSDNESKSTIGPGAELKHIFGTQIDSTEMNLYISSQLVVLAIALYITYDDIFQNCHYLNSCFKYSADLNAFVACPSGMDLPDIPIRSGCDNL